MLILVILYLLLIHQTLTSYTDFVNVADVITNYSKAGIPLETMWTDIDYMFKRWIFTNDPQYFPTDRMREIVNYLHAHDQQYSTVPIYHPKLTA